MEGVPSPPPRLLTGDAQPFVDTADRLAAGAGNAATGETTTGAGHEDPTTRESNTGEPTTGETATGETPTREAVTEPGTGTRLPPEVGMEYGGRWDTPDLLSNTVTPTDLKLKEVYGD